MQAKGFIVTRVQAGFICWCHYCHIKKFFKSKHPGLNTVRAIAKDSLDPDLRKLKSVVTVTRSIKLPDDFTLDIPQAGLMWLQLYGVTEEEQRHFRIGYSQTLDRVILPVFKEDKLVYFQGRNVYSDNRPKYINVKAASRNDVYFGIETDSDITVVVEDIISSIAVTRAGFSAVALLGSYVNCTLIQSILSPKSNRYLIWLDSDKRSESVKIAKKFRSFGVRSSSILLPRKDPKDYSQDEIKNIILTRRVRNET